MFHRYHEVFGKSVIISVQWISYCLNTSCKRMGLILATTLLFVQILLSGGTYQTSYIEDLCEESNSGVWNLGSASANSSGILKTSKNGDYLRGFNCSIFIQPPLGFGVVLSVRFLDFRPFYPPKCDSYIQIHENDRSNKLCGFSNDISEYQSYYTERQAMQLQFSTVNMSGTDYFSDIIFIATSYMSLQYSCEMKMFECRNSRCIWNGLKCDGHNNCGDQSDESTQRSAQCGMMPAGLIAGIVVGSVMGFILLVLLTFAFFRWRSKVRSSERQPTLNYGTYSIGTNIQERENPQGSTSNARYQDPPPAYKPYF